MRSILPLLLFMFLLTPPVLAGGGGDAPPPKEPVGEKEKAPDPEEAKIAPEEAVKDKEPVDKDATNKERTSQSASTKKPVETKPGGVTGALDRIGEDTPAKPRPQARIRIGGSVGRGGVNLPEDVLKIQEALVAKGYLKSGEFRPGAADSATVKAIEEFQRKEAGFRRPDGRVDTNNRTIAALNGQTFSPARTSSSSSSSNSGGLRGRKGPRVSSSSEAPTVTRGIEGKPAKSMTAEEAFAELDRLGVEYERMKASHWSSLGISDPVRIKAPILGVILRYTERSAPRNRTIDVRLAVGIAHLIQFIKKDGGTHILDWGMHVTRKRGKNTTGKHARGMAIDIGSFKFAEGKTIAFPRDWKTGRSSTRRLQGFRGVVTQNDAEKQAMEAPERWLRKVWGFLVSEFNVVVTPSHNKEHWSHFHADLHQTSRQKVRSARSFRENDHDND